jgi:hypothetical protein
MLRNYLETARILKRDLAKDFWHKEVIFIITALDLEFQKCFQYFVREKNAVLQMCEELLKKEYCTIDEVKDNIVLNLRAAKDFIEKIERIFSEDYETHKNEIHQAAQIFDIIHKASQMKANDIQPNKLQGAPVEKQQKTNSINLETKLKPIVETHRNIGIVELEEQLTNRLEEITSTLRKTPHINIVNLKYSQLFLNQNDIAILLSQGNMVESALQVKSYSYIRKMLAFLAELQETLALFSQKHFNSITCQQTVGYILKQAQEIVKEAEFINQQVQNQTNISSSINLISVKNRLMQQAQKVYESLNSFSYMNAQATSLANANIATLQAV